MFQNWKWYNTHILHNYTLQIDFPCLTNVMSNSGREWVPTIITLVLFTIFGQSQQSLTQYNFFFFEGPKLLLNLVSFTCSCSPINFTMEQKGQPQVSKFYQLSRCTSSPFDPKAKNTWSLSPPFSTKDAMSLRIAYFHFYPFTNFTHHRIFFYNTQIIQNRICTFTQFTKFENGPKLQNCTRLMVHHICSVFYLSISTLWVR